MALVEYVLPLPPTLNHYYTVARGRKILSGKGRQYADDVAACVLSAGRVRLGDVRLELRLVVHPRTAHKTDISNRIKPCEDALVKCGVMDDDSQVDRLVVERGEVVRGGRVVATLSEM